MKQEEEYWRKYNEKHGSKGKEVKPTESGTEKALEIWEQSKDFYELPRPEVIRRLRERNEPIRVFGESDEDSLRRLRKFEFEAPEIEQGFEQSFTYLNIGLATVNH